MNEKLIKHIRLVGGHVSEERETDPSDVEDDLRTNERHVDIYLSQIETLMEQSLALALAKMVWVPVEPKKLLDGMQYCVLCEDHRGEKFPAIVIWRKRKWWQWWEEELGAGITVLRVLCGNPLPILGVL